LDTCALRRGARGGGGPVALRPDLMRAPELTFHRGDAFRFQPDSPVDWLLCDVIAAPERSIGLLLHWLEKPGAGIFVVTIKFRDRPTTPTRRTQAGIAAAL
jgi:23S rRNA (cytidine2498-2'-O)-methyltransferase